MTFRRFAVLVAIVAGLFVSQTTALLAQDAGQPVSTININTATQEQFESLPGVGAKTAQRILEHRQKNGPFKKVEELMNIKGIGEKSFLKLKPYLSIGASRADKPSPGGQA